MKLRLLPLVLLAAGSLFSLQGCSPTSNVAFTNDIDPAGGLSRQDYLNLRHREPPADEPVPPIPSLPDPGTEDMAASPLDRPVSLTVTDSVPVRDVLLELTRKTGSNLELDPRVTGSVIISAHNQPFREVLQRVCAMANLRYTVDGNFIHIEPDDAFHKSYRLDYLALARKTSSETAIATNVFDVDVTNNNSGSGTGGGSASTMGNIATQNNSTSKVSGVSEADFWAETEKAVAQILNGDGKSAKGTFSVNKQAGIVSVYGNQRQQRAVEAYFGEVRRKSYAQVLIDARIVEVELDDGYQAGINWSRVFKDGSSIAADFTAPIAAGSGVFTATTHVTDLDALISLVETFGTTRVLSAPRVTVLNNQTGVMKVATNQVYFITQAQFTTVTNASGAAVTTTPVFTSTPHTVPVGLVMTVQPAIDASNNRITMTLRPTITRVTGEVNDPSISLNAAAAGVNPSSVQSQIPVLAVREMDSVIQLHSGEVAVMGGLMQDQSINQDQGIPVLDTIPYIGNLFKSRSNDGKTSELVILLKATIADQPTPDKADGTLYHYYNNDPRPLNVPDLNPRLAPEASEQDPTS